MRTRTIALAALLALVAGACSLAEDEPSSPSSAAITTGTPTGPSGATGVTGAPAHRRSRAAAPRRRRGPHRRRAAETRDRGLRLPPERAPSIRAGSVAERSATSDNFTHTFTVERRSTSRSRSTRWRHRSRRRTGARTEARGGSEPVPLRDPPRDDRHDPFDDAAHGAPLRSRAGRAPSGRAAIPS